MSSLVRNTLAGPYPEACATSTVSLVARLAPHTVFMRSPRPQHAKSAAVVGYDLHGHSSTVRLLLSVSRKDTTFIAPTRATRAFRIVWHRPDSSRATAAAPIIATSTPLQTSRLQAGAEGVQGNVPLPLTPPPQSRTKGISIRQKKGSLLSVSDTSGHTTVDDQPAMMSVPTQPGSGSPAIALRTSALGGPAVPHRSARSGTRFHTVGSCVASSSMWSMSLENSDT